MPKLPSSFQHFLSTRSVERPTGPLYHYTGAEGVNGILLNGCLWATNFSFLNDPSEVEYGRRLVLKILSETQGISCDATTALGDSFDRQISEVYIFSLTECRDDLSQWRAYGSAGAVRYCIGFDSVAISDLVSDQRELIKQNDFVLDGISLRKIIYEEPVQREEVQWWIDRTIRAIQECSDESQDIIEFVARGLAQLVPRLKDPAYKKEEEWRIIHWLPADSVSEVHFITARGFIRPYIKIPTNHEERTYCHGEEVNKPQPLRVTELLVLAPGREAAAEPIGPGGPHNKAHTFSGISVKAANMLLRKAGIADVEAQRSKVPFAG